MAGRDFMSAAFLPYAPSVPFERLAGPYLIGDGVLPAFQTHANHAGVRGQVHPAAIMAFGDFALYALINHHSGGAYANRAPSDEETIVTLTADFDMLRDVAVGEMLIARGHVIRESKRLIVVRGVITTADGRHVARIGGLWSKTLMPLRADTQSLAPQTVPHSDALSFRAHLSMQHVPVVIGPQHCNDLAIAHGGCLISLAVMAIEDALEKQNQSGALLTFHADFLAAGRDGQALDASLTLIEGRAAMLHMDGAVISGDTRLIAFNAISQLAGLCPVGRVFEQTDSDGLDKKMTLR
jgi:acyl-coenzyme A thioesterase PaaI-like protein